jgi:hypothetical protein
MLTDAYDERDRREAASFFYRPQTNGNRSGKNGLEGATTVGERTDSH